MQQPQPPPSAHTEPTKVNDIQESHQLDDEFALPTLPQHHPVPLQDTSDGNNNPMQPPAPAHTPLADIAGCIDFLDAMETAGNNSHNFSVPPVPTSTNYFRFSPVFFSPASNDTPPYSTPTSPINNSPVAVKPERHPSPVPQYDNVSEVTIDILRDSISLSNNLPSNKPMSPCVPLTNSPSPTANISTPLPDNNPHLATTSFSTLTQLTASIAPFPVRSTTATFRRPPTPPLTRSPHSPPSRPSTPPRRHRNVPPPTRTRLSPGFGLFGSPLRSVGRQIVQNIRATRPSQIGEAAEYSTPAESPEETPPPSPSDSSSSDSENYDIVVLETYVFRRELLLNGGISQPFHGRRRSPHPHEHMLHDTLHSPNRPRFRLVRPPLDGSIIVCLPDSTRTTIHVHMSFNATCRIPPRRFPIQQARPVLQASLQILVSMISTIHSASGIRDIFLNPDPRLTAAFVSYVERRFQNTGPILFNDVDHYSRITPCPPDEHNQRATRLPGRTPLGYPLDTPRLTLGPCVVRTPGPMAPGYFTDVRLLHWLFAPIEQLFRQFEAASFDLARVYQEVPINSPYQHVLIESHFNYHSNRWPAEHNTDTCLSLPIIENVIHRLYPSRQTPLRVRAHTLEEVLVDECNQILVPCTITTAATNSLERITIDPHRVVDLFSITSLRFFVFLRLMAYPHTMACELFNPLLLVFLRLQFVATHQHRK